MSVVLSDLGLISLSGYQVDELFDGNNLGFHRADDKLIFNVNPSGIDAYIENLFFTWIIYLFFCVFCRCGDGQVYNSEEKETFQ